MHVMGVPSQGALFFTCQGGRSSVSVSDSGTQFMNTTNRHGTTKTPTDRVGPGCALRSKLRASQAVSRKPQAAKGRTRGGIPDLERVVPAAAEHTGTIWREGAGAHGIGVPAQGALFYTCQGGHGPVSDSTTHRWQTRIRHGTTKTPSGTRLCATQ